MYAWKFRGVLLKKKKHFKRYPGKELNRWRNRSNFVFQKRRRTGCFFCALRIQANHTWRFRESLLKNDSTFHTRRIPTVARAGDRQFFVFFFFFFVSACYPTSQSIRGSPTSHSTFKDSRGGSWRFQMVVFYGFTLFTNWFLAMWNKNRCLPPSTPPEPPSAPTEARRKNRGKGARGRTLERRTTRAALYDVYKRVPTNRKYVDVTLRP